MRNGCGLVVFIVALSACDLTGPTNRPTPHYEITADFLSHADGSYANPSGETITINAKTRLYSRETPSTAFQEYRIGHDADLIKNGLPVCKVVYSGVIDGVATVSTGNGETHRPFIDLHGYTTEVAFLDQDMQSAPQDESTPAGRAKKICFEQTSSVTGHTMIPVIIYSRDLLLLGRETTSPPNADEKLTKTQIDANTFRRIY